MNITINKSTESKVDLALLKRKQINLAVFGHGNVGSLLIDQILASRKEILKRRSIDFNIFAIANSSTLLLNGEGVDINWNQTKNKKGVSYAISDVISFAKKNNLENLIAIDNTANKTIVDEYKSLVEAGFNLVSSNKIGNTLGLDYYQQLRNVLIQNKKEYLYETNVGAGLPLVDTIKLLHLSGENITRIKGIFSGSLSYLFNNFSENKEPFSKVLQSAISKGFTEPDPREDLGGNDVGRKLLILARELELHNELSDVKIENLIPKSLRNISKEDFLNSLNEFDVPFHLKKKNQKPNHVLRYVGDLYGDLSKNDGAILEVRLISVPKIVH